MLQKHLRKFLLFKGMVENWFSKFHSDDMSLRDESRPGCLSDLNQDALRKLSIYLNISQFTNYRPLKKKGKVSKLGILILHTLRSI